MTAPESLTPVGDRLRDVFGGAIARGTTHPPGCSAWHVLCAHEAGRAEALRQLAADLEAEAKDIEDLDDIPWAAMLGLHVPNAPEAAAILRRAAEVARLRADGSASTAGVTRG